MKNISHLKFPAFNKKFLIGIISSVLLVIIIGCDDTSTGPDYPDEISYVRVIHQSSAKNQLDITYEWLQSGNRHTLLRDLEYGEQYGYYTFETAPIVFRAYYSNTSVTASVDTLEMEDEKGYTIFVNDLSASINPRLMTFEDTNEQPNEGKVFVRFINLAPMQI